MIPGTWRSLIQYNHFSILFLIKLSLSKICNIERPETAVQFAETTIPAIMYFQHYIFSHNYDDRVS